MLFFIRHGEKEYQVRVESREERLFVSLDGGPERPVDLVFYGHDVSFVEPGRVFYANVVGGKDDYTVWRPEGNIQLRVESEYRRIVSLLRGQELGGENNVYAKMPGKIVKVMAKKGDAVEKGQSVMVMEAMKMENEIRTTVAGTVANINISEGQAVETGALLMELTPEE